MPINTQSVMNEVNHAYVYGGTTPPGTEIVQKMLMGNPAVTLEGFREKVPTIITNMKTALEELDLETFASRTTELMGMALICSSCDPTETLKVVQRAVPTSELGQVLDADWLMDVLIRNTHGAISRTIKSGRPDLTCDRIADTIVVATVLATQNPDAVVEQLLAGTEMEEQDLSSLPRVVWRLPEHTQAFQRALLRSGPQDLETELKTTLGLAIGGYHFIEEKHVEGAPDKP